MTKKVSLDAASVFLGRRTEIALEDAVEVAEIVITDTLADFRDLHAGCFQEKQRLVQALHLHQFGKRFAGFPFDFPA